MTNPIESLGLSPIVAARYFQGDTFNYKSFLELAQRVASTEYRHFHPDRNFDDEAASHFKDVVEAQNQLSTADPVEQERIVNELFMPMGERATNLRRELTARIQAIDMANKKRVKRYLETLVDLALGNSSSVRGLKTGLRIFVVNPQDEDEYVAVVPNKRIEYLALVEREDGVVFVGKIAPDVICEYVSNLGKSRHLQTYMQRMTNSSVISIKSDKEGRTPHNWTFVYEFDTNGDIRVLNTEQEYPLITRNIKRYKPTKNEIVVKQQDSEGCEKKQYFNRFRVCSINNVLTEKLKGYRIIGALEIYLLSHMRNKTIRAQEIKQGQEGHFSNKQDDRNLFGIEKQLQVPANICELLKKEYTINELADIINALGSTIFSTMPTTLNHELLVACKKDENGKIKLAILGRFYKVSLDKSFIS